jgi:hypothetical protein
MALTLNPMQAMLAAASAGADDAKFADVRAQF